MHTGANKEHQAAQPRMTDSLTIPAKWTNTHETFGQYGRSVWVVEELRVRMTTMFLFFKNLQDF
jgi:hypothetical protein